MTDVPYQTTAGRTDPCCDEMSWALSLGYIRKGYLYRRHDPPRWISWGFNMAGTGWTETSPIRYCPFCGVDLDQGE